MKFSSLDYLSTLLALSLATGLGSVAAAPSASASLLSQRMKNSVSVELVSGENGSKQSPPADVSTLLEVEGSLDSDDPTLDDGSFYEEHSFVGRANQRVEINMESSEFDTYVLLYGPDGEVLGENDDISPSNYNSRLVLTLPQDGTYTIYANAFDSAQRGVYLLSVSTNVRPGDLQATLRWGTIDDLDVVVRDPAGDIVSFETTSIGSGGQLDGDDNALCQNVTETPAETIFWPNGQAPDGEYTVFVSLYSRCANTQGPIPYTLILNVQGRTETYEGTIDESNDIVAYPVQIF